MILACSSICKTCSCIVSGTRAVALEIGVALGGRKGIVDIAEAALDVAGSGEADGEDDGRVQERRHAGQ